MGRARCRLTMPIYEYSCPQCGPFTALRPLAQFDLPTPCPSCGASAERALLTAPSLGFGAARRRAAGLSSDEATAPVYRNAAHGSACACCVRPPSSSAIGVSETTDTAVP